jgi:sigma-B regulation protein RsbU (phosphoserine phosphatase)
MTSARPRAILTALAVLFAGAVTLYSGLWIYVVHAPDVYLGIHYDTTPGEPSLLVEKVLPDSPAEAAGLRAGDRLTHVGGRPLATRRPLHQALGAGRPGDRVQLQVIRPGHGVLSLEAVLKVPQADPMSPLRRVVDEVLGFYPVLFLLVGMSVLFLRAEDRNAWLLAAVFASFIAGAPLLGWEGRIPAPARGFALAYKIAFNGMGAGLFLFFFSVFPARSPLDRRLPALKWLWIVTAGGVVLPLAAAALVSGSADPLYTLEARLPGLLVKTLALVYVVGGYGLGMASLAASARSLDPLTRRRSRVILWGMLVGLTPGFALGVLAPLFGRDMYELPFWLWASCVLAFFFIPLSFAYAVVRHRVVEIPVLLRQSARYLLVQRGSLLLLFLLGVGSTTLFAALVARALLKRAEHVPAVAIALGSAFGIVLVWAGSLAQRRLRERIDRAFFRQAYDARQILQDLAERAWSTTSRHELAGLLEQHLASALVPSRLAVYLEESPGRLRRFPGGPDGVPDTLEAPWPWLADLAGDGAPRLLAPGAGEHGPLAPFAPECLVPLVGRDARPTGLIALGPRRSEEPYSREDKRLLASAASQAGMALETMRLADDMAARLEVERRAAHEMELAQEVQRRLLPQEAPVLRTLDYSGLCVQARAVGGDYYDFLDLAPGQLGLALADICGKGFPAALLMANLQASLRSRSAHELVDIARQLRVINQLLYRASESSRYATLFLGLYDDSTRRMRYANCGHNPPVLLRADGRWERLMPTAPVLGLFLDTWECETAEVSLERGDLLALYTDGLTEAWSDDGEEFGESRLLEALRTHREQAADDVLNTLLSTVRAFSGSEQDDDLTLVVARVVA